VARPEEPGELLQRWESLVERSIREAQERGDFDGLPYQGQRLPDPDDAYAGDQAASFRILRNNRAAPPWIEADKEARRLLDERDRLRERYRRSGRIGREWHRRQLADLVRRHADAVAALNALAPTPRQHRVPLRLEEEIAALDAPLD
jgi:hypothetical protein